MEEIDYKKLIEIVNDTSKKNYIAYECDGKLTPNVANLGAKKGEVARLERSGEYHGIAVEFMEDAMPILTDNFIKKILKLLHQEDYVTPLTLLKITHIDQLNYILHTWFDSATVSSSSKNPFVSEKKYPIFDPWIKSVTHDPLLVKIKIVEVGQNQNTGAPVVPIEWIGREFESGYALHTAMNKLDTRIGRPPVTFAIIYSMIVQKQETIIKNVENIPVKHIFYLDLVDEKIDYEITHRLRKKSYDYVRYGKILIGFKLEELLEPKQSADKLQEVGILVSRLQKAIRRGRYASKILRETIQMLNESPNYNLPEHGFLRVSASKQLVWRLFISILEDCRPYQSLEELSLLELILLVLITQKCLEYKFTKPVMDQIELTALMAQFNDDPSDSFGWKNYNQAENTSIDPESDYYTAISLALEHIPMMKGDQNMLRKLYSVESDIFETFNVPKKFYHKKSVYEDVALSSIDHHCKPQLILYYQASIPISMTTKEISSYIWRKSSSYNVRSTKSPLVPDSVLRNIQTYFYQNKHKISTKKNNYTEKISTQKNQINNHTQRTSFLILFGKKYRHKNKEVIMAGTHENPAKIKINNEWVCSNNSEIINGYPEQIIDLSKIDPPFGYKWRKNKVVTKIIDTKPYIDNKIIPFFDGTSLLKYIHPQTNKLMSKKTYRLIIKILSGMDIDFETILMLREKKIKTIKNWSLIRKDLMELDLDLVRLTYTKLFNQSDNLIMIGPVDRSGSKIQNSINYLYEGKLWTVFNLFSYLYPTTFRPNGALNFVMNRETSGFVHLVHTLESILFTPTKIQGAIPNIKTVLWDHQKDSVNKIVASFKRGKKGFGDASSVGSGKTLTSLKIATDLIRMDHDIYSGILVMLPGNQLIETWRVELDKHTEGFDVKFHQTDKIIRIQKNTIVITTMGRMRDHPINHKWLLVIIDECLSVQNKNALQTEEAFKQSLMSKYLIMMSATFFRTRFEKLYYMLKMLQTGLPEQREYLDSILSESIVSKIANTARKWTSTTHYFELGTKSKQTYQEIEQLNLTLEQKYAKLTSFLVTNAKTKNTLVKQLQKLVGDLENSGRKCVIYARSNEEAEIWSEYLKVPLYPEKHTHTIITYRDGTYGLNDLVVFDTIVMRPPQPDKLPQIKGRLDRYGQTSDNLWIEYFVLKDTIEEGLLLRIDIASQFVHQYIMPLARFYDISVNHKKYLKN